MKLLPLDGIHRRFAQMGECNGWILPRAYRSAETEFDAANAHAALFDATFMGRLAVGGSDAKDLLHRLTTNELLAGGSTVESTFVTDKGRVLDAVTILPGKHPLLITSSGMEETLMQWIDRYTITEDVSVTHVTDETALFLLVGPESIALASEAFAVPLAPGGYAESAGSETRLGAPEDPRGTRVFVVTGKEKAGTVWERLVEKGQQRGLQRMGVDAYEAYRISRGIPARGAELSAEFNPFEVGLGGTISRTKGCYLGQEVLARLETYQKIRRRLAGLVFSVFPEGAERPLALQKDGDDVGLLTSISPGAVHGRRLGLGVVRTDRVHEGESLTVTVGSEQYHCVALTPPILV